MSQSRANPHIKRFCRTRWCNTRALVNKCLGEGLVAFTVMQGTDNSWYYHGPDEFLQKIIKPAQKKMESEMVAWQEANPVRTRGASGNSTGAGNLAVTRTVLCRPPKPVDQLKCDDVRSRVSTWIRALNPSTSMPKYGDPETRPDYWPEDIPWVQPSKAPKGYPGDWTMAMRKVLRSMLLYVGEDPDTYCAQPSQPVPAPPQVPDQPDRDTSTREDLPAQATPDEDSDSDPDFSMLNDRDSLTALVDSPVSMSTPASSPSPTPSPPRRKRATPPPASPRRPSGRPKKARVAYTPSLY